MKASMTLKPLVFAMAAVMAAGAAQAGSNDRHHRYDHKHYKPPVAGTPLDPNAGDAYAYAGRDQYIGSAEIGNEGTENTTEVDNSLRNSNGNIGANAASGSMNQQANNVAIATSDEDFVFGVATAESDIYQEGDAHVSNVGGSNSATVSDSGNGSSGNIGLNAASGNANQQQNALAIATTSGYEATATATGSQSLSGSVDNKAGSATYTTSFDFTKDKSHKHVGWNDSYSRDTYQGSGEKSSSSYKNSESSYKANKDSYKNASLELNANADASLKTKSSSSQSSSWKKEIEVEGSFDRNRHGFEAEFEIEKSKKSEHDSKRSFEGSASLHVDADLEVKKSSGWSSEHESKSKSSKGSEYAYSKESSETHKSKSKYGEVDNSSLATTVTITKSYEFTNPLVNNTTLSGSLNNVSGNIGVNVASGSSNQQLNSLAVAVGCTACNN